MAMIDPKEKGEGRKGEGRKGRRVGRARTMV